MRAHFGSLEYGNFSALKFVVVVVVALLAHPIKMGLPIPITMKCNINC